MKKQTIEKDFCFETEFMDIKGTVAVDISGDYPVFWNMNFEDELDVLATLKDYIKECLQDDESFDTRILRIEEKDHQASEDADAWRKEHG